jgi:axial budding pattern protein 2
LDDAETQILYDFGESSYGDIGDGSVPSHRPHGSMKIPVELAKHSSHNSTTSFRKHKRRTTTVYRDRIHRSSGLPVNRRIIGMGMYGTSLSRLGANVLVVSTLFSILRSFPSCDAACLRNALNSLNLC